MEHKTQTRNTSNTIRRIIAADGSILTDLQDIKKEVSSHFENFLQGIPSEFEPMSHENLQELIDYRYPPLEAATLVAPVQASEIKEALFFMPTNKAPGPDGFPMEFYKVAWSIIGKDFIIAIQSFFLYGFLPKSINSTLLYLVPKTTTAERMSDFRPIAYCNVVYKVISRIIARRIKATLPEAIELNQCAFIEGRFLLENVLLATELVKDYHKDIVSTRAAIKLDISKGFDTVQLSFIEATLRAINYPKLIITWIMRCIDTAGFSVLVNGELEGFFSSARGVSQGFSLSPYIYVIVSNVLSKLLNKAVSAGSVGYHPWCREVNLSHLSFADDIVVFTDGSPTSLEGTLQVFDDFARCSGLSINIVKSTVFAAGRGKQSLEAAANRAGLSVSVLPIQYLGLPLKTKIMSRSDYEPLLKKIRNRFLSWTSYSLLYGGQLKLIKSVIASITNFWCASFCLSQGCIDEVQSMCSAFL